MARDGSEECVAFDGWVSPEDIRWRAKVFGSHTPGIIPDYWTGRIVASFPPRERALVWMDCPMSTSERMFWLIDINPDCSWHYHKEA